MRWHNECSGCWQIDLTFNVHVNYTARNICIDTTNIQQTQINFPLDSTDEFELPRNPESCVHSLKLRKMFLVASSMKYCKRHAHLTCSAESTAPFSAERCHVTVTSLKNISSIESSASQKRKRIHSFLFVSFSFFFLKQNQIISIGEAGSAGPYWRNIVRNNLLAIGSEVHLLCVCELCIGVALKVFWVIRNSEHQFACDWKFYT